MTIPSSSLRTTTLNTYRNLLRYAKNLTETQNKTQVITRIKTEFRKHRTETKTETIEKLIKDAESSLGYLKIITPRRPNNNQQGVTRIVFGDADAKKEGRAMSNWTGKNLDPDSVKKHYHQLKRAGFKNNSHAKGFF